MMPNRRGWLAIVFIWLVVAAIAYALTACSSPRIEYRMAPVWLIPAHPVLPTVTADELSCLSDDVYVRLARRDRLRAQESAELRAILEGGDAR